jgi:hypothetical protein
MALTRNRVLLAKLENSYGTNPTPAGGDALKISSVDVSPLEVELVDRELITPYFGNTQKVISQRMVSVSFSVELAGSGVVGTPPAYGKILRACGFNQAISAGTSVTYSPVSSGFESVTMDFRADGTRHIVTGARGTVSLSAETGSIPTLDFEMMGLFNDPTDAALPAVTFGDQADPLVINAENTLDVLVHGYAGCLQSLSLDVGNNVVYRQLAGCSRQVILTDRKPEGSVSVEAPTIASKDYFAAVSAQALGEVSFVHGTTAGNIVTFTAPNCNLGSPAYGDSDGTILLELPFMPNPNTGNDEFTLVFT